MRGLSDIIKRRKNSHRPYQDMAKDYQKKAAKAFNIFLKNFPEANNFACYGITIKKLDFKERTVELNFDPKKKIYYSDCKSEDILYEEQQFVRPSHLNKNYWFEGREFGEIEPLLDELRRLGFRPMWRLDKEHTNYILYIISFAI